MNAKKRGKVSVSGGDTIWKDNTNTQAKQSDGLSDCHPWRIDEILMPISRETISKMAPQPKTRQRARAWKKHEQWNMNIRVMNGLIILDAFYSLMIFLLNTLR